MDALMRRDPGSSEGRSSQTFVNGFARGLAVIESFTDAPDALSLAEVAVRAGLDRAVARRMLLTLTELGFVVQTRGRFRLTPRVMRLGYAFLSQANLDGMLRPFLVELTQRLGESISVSVLDGAETVVVCHVTTTIRKTGLLMREGSRWPAYVVASGRILLAGLPDDEVRSRVKDQVRPLTGKTLATEDAVVQAVQAARRAGYALVDEELEEGLISVSVPIRNRQGRFIASLNASSAKGRASEATMHTVFLPAMLETSAEIGRVLPEEMLSHQGGI